MTASRRSFRTGNARFWPTGADRCTRPFLDILGRVPAFVFALHRTSLPRREWQLTVVHFWWSNDSKWPGGARRGGGDRQRVLPTPWRRSRLSALELSDSGTRIHALQFAR